MDDGDGAGLPSFVAAAVHRSPTESLAARSPTPGVPISLLGLSTSWMGDMNGGLWEGFAVGFVARPGGDSSSADAAGRASSNPARS